MTQFNDKVSELNALEAVINNSIGTLGTYGVPGQRIRFISDPTYTINSLTDIGWTLVFTEPAGCVLDIDTGLFDGMWFRVVQFTGAGAITFSNTPFTSTASEGEICTFTMVQKNINPTPDVYLVDSSRVVEDAQSSQVIINNDSTLVISNIHSGKTIVMTRPGGAVITVNDGLATGIEFDIIKYSAQGTQQGFSN